MLPMDENRDPKRLEIQSGENAPQGVPEEFNPTHFSLRPRQPHAIEYSLLTWASVVFTFGALIPFFSKPFFHSPVALRATSLEGGEALGFVTFMESFEETSGSKMKDVFGWGALDLVSRASEALAPHLQACRARLENEAGGKLSFRFDVKVEVAKPGFVVNGLLEGADREPAMAACLRDKINNLKIGDFAHLRSAPPKSYKLRLGVQMAHGADGGAP